MLSPSAASAPAVANRLPKLASHHLRVLRGAGLAAETRDGTRHLFVVRTDGLAAVRDLLDGFWPTRLAALKQAAEAEARHS